MNKARAIFACLSALGLIAVERSYAQPASPEPQMAGAAEEIIVTARRREESLQDVPLSVTAISGDVLERRHIQNVQQLTSAVPSLGLSTTTPVRDTIAFAIRGQRSNETTILSDPPVGLYFAEMVQPRPYGFGYALYDLQSVQVLKGVQGTSFGRNMTAGAILIEPQHPKHEFEAEIKGETGNYGMWSTYGMVNLPLVQEKLAVRLNGIIKQRDGFTIDNRSARDYDNLDYWSGRASVLLTPSDFVENLTIYDTVLAKTNGTGASLSHVRRSANSAFGTPAIVNIGAANLNLLDQYFAQQQALGPRRVVGSVYNHTKSPYPGQQPYTKTLNWGITNKTKIEVGDLTIHNILGYRRIDFRRFQDFYNVPLNIISSQGGDRISMYSEELRVDGRAFEERLEWTMGAYGFVESGRGDYSHSVQFAELSPTPHLTGRARFGDGTAISYAIFGTGEYALTDHWKISGGLRWNHDQRSAQNAQINYATGTCGLAAPFTTATPPNNCFLSNGNAWRAVTWDVTLKWEPSNNSTLYVSQRSGFRSGGFAMRGTDFASMTAFNPEHAKETEFGVKQRWDANGTRIRLDGALFWQNLTNVQVQLPTLVSGTLATITVNTGAQKNYGGEFEMGLTFPWGLDLSGYYAFVNVADTINRPFNALIAVPKHQLGLTANYTFPFDESVGEVVLGMDTVYKSNIHLDDLDETGDQDGHMLANVHLDWNEAFGTGLGLGLFANNVFDKVYKTGGSFNNDSIGLNSTVYGEPRMWGGSIKYKF